LDPFATEKDEELVASIPLVKGNPVVFFDLAVNGEAAGRVVFQLRKVSINSLDVCWMRRRHHQPHGSGVRRRIIGYRGSCPGCHGDVAHKNFSPSGSLSRSLALALVP
jgi:hypothetical protein